MSKIQCAQCSKKFDGFHFLSLRSYEEDGQIKVVARNFDFCSKDCVDSFREKNKAITELRLYKISRCVGYYDCKRLDNLRVMCEDEEALEGRGSGIYAVMYGINETMNKINRGRVRTCNPSDVAIIKSSLKMMDLTEEFNKASAKLTEETLLHTKTMNRLTKWILGFTIANAAIVILSLLSIWLRK